MWIENIQRNGKKSASPYYSSNSIIHCEYFTIACCCNRLFNYEWHCTKYTSPVHPNASTPVMMCIIFDTVILHSLLWSSNMAFVSDWFVFSLHKSSFYFSYTFWIPFWTFELKRWRHCYIKCAIIHHFFLYLYGKRSQNTTGYNRSQIRFWTNQNKTLKIIHKNQINK